MKKQKKKIKDLERGLVSVEDYQKIKSAVEGKDNYHAVRKESKCDILPKQINKRISIEELKDIELNETDNSNILFEVLH